MNFQNSKVIFHFNVLNQHNINQVILNLERSQIQELRASKLGSNAKIDFSHENFHQTPIFKHISFNRQVLSCLLDPKLTQLPNLFHKDILNRANRYLARIPSVGVYSEALGFQFLRESAAKFFQQRDRLPSLPDPDTLILTQGTTLNSFLMIKMLIADSRDGIMLPIPHPPLFNHISRMTGASEIHYNLDSKQNWVVTRENLETAYKNSRNLGINPQVFLLINPGNPTGRLMEKGELITIIEFCYQNQLVIFSDQSYYDTLLSDKPSNSHDQQFFSINRIQQQMGKPYQSIETISTLSASKGFNGEAGFRSSLCFMSGFQDDIHKQVQKLQGMSIHSCTLGQFLIDLILHPPNQLDCSQETIDRHRLEIDYNRQILRNNFLNLKEIIQSIDKRNEVWSVDGGYNLLAKIQIGEQILQEAKEKQINADQLFVNQMLSNHGLLIAPGSSFKLEMKDDQGYVVLNLLNKIENKNEIYQAFTSLRNG